MVASASAPSRLTAIQRITRKIFGMRAICDEYPASIVAKKRRLRKRRVSQRASQLLDHTEHRGTPGESGFTPCFPVFLRAPCGESFEEQLSRREPRDNLIHSGSLKHAVRAEYIRSGGRTHIRKIIRGLGDEDWSAVRRGGLY